MNPKQITLVTGLTVAVLVGALWLRNNAERPLPGTSPAPSPAAPATSPTPNAAATANPAQPAAAAPTASTTNNVDLGELRRWIENHRDMLERAGAQPLPADVLAQGRALAEARKPAMLQQIRENPRRALDQSLRWDEWAALPPDIRSLVETPFSAQGDFSVVPDCRPADARNTPWQTHRLTVDGQYFDAFIYGRREQVMTKNGLSVQGIRLENLAALWETPLHPLAGAELAAAQKFVPDGNPRNRSYVTGAELAGEPHAALLSGRVFYFANDAELHSVAEVISSAEVTRGPNIARVAMFQLNGDIPVFNPAEFQRGFWPASAWTETPKNVLALRIDYSPNVGTPYTNQAELRDNMLACSNTVRQMSFGKTWIVPTVPAQVFSLPNPKSYYETNAGGADELMAHALAMAHAAGFNTNNFDIYVVGMPILTRYADAAAFAQVGGRYHWINGNWFPGVTTHEFGHNYGIVHANFWRTEVGAGYLGRQPSEGQSGTHEEYGDPFDIMGDAYNAYPGGHFSMHSKAYFNWIEPAEVVTVATSGVYRVYRFDHENARATPGRVLALKVTATTGEELWVGYRRGLALYPALASGAYVVWGNNANDHRLLNATPLSAPNGVGNADKADAPVPLCNAFTDPSGTVQITTLTTGGATPAEYIDVRVDLLPNQATYAIYTTSDRSVRGLTGSYVNSSLRGRPAQEDWRSTPGVTISGTRVDTQIKFIGNGWGARGPVGVTGGSDADWENFSVQWDGWLAVNKAVRLATRTDDGSRMWIDLDGSGTFSATKPEFVNNNWGNGQGPAIGEFSGIVPPGLYRIRIQYEEGNGGNVCELLVGSFSFDLFADAALTTNGLTGSYVNSSLRAYAPQDDWRTTQAIAGRRLDNYPLFMGNGWGDRAPLSLTGGANTDWETFSVQWDGWLRAYEPLRLVTLSDDGSRMWVDVNSNGTFAATAPEFINNHWGAGQGDTFGDVSTVIPAGTYRIRLQYEEGNGGNHFALLGAAQPIPGAAGYALCFDGVDDHMTLASAGLNLPTNEITIEFWQRAYEQRDQSTFALTPDQSTNRVSSHVPWQDGTVYWDFGSIAGAGRLAYVPPPGVIGNWHHWALVSSRAGNFQRIYRNGVQEAADSSAATFVRYAATLRLGMSGVGSPFRGELEEFRIWSVARSASQIQSNMLLRISGPQPDLWAYWRFDDGTGTTVTDLSGNGRHGTLVNGANWVVSTVPTNSASAFSTNVVTTLADSGAGSLRQALLNANGAGSGLNYITFAVSGTITLLSPLPIINVNLLLLGPGPNQVTVSGNNAYDIFSIGGGQSVRISGLRLIQGFSVNHGAAVRNNGITVLENCRLEQNFTVNSFGGAVCSFPGSSLFVTNCLFATNVMQGGQGENRGPGSNGGPGGGAAGMGGAIFSDGDVLAISDCQFLGNRAQGGNGGNGDGNSFNNDPGGNGGFPNRGVGGAAGQPGGNAGFGGGGGGGAGSGTAGFAGGNGGFGGGGGSGGARGLGGDGGLPGLGGRHGGAAGASTSSHSGGGGGGAGLGGAIFANAGQVTVVNSLFVGNVATNGVGGVGSFGGGNGAPGQGVGGAIYTAGARLTVSNSSYCDNLASTTEPDVNCLRLYYPFDNFGATDLGYGASTVTYQGSASGPWYNSDHRGGANSAIALNDPGFGTNNYYRITTPHDPTNSNRGLGLKGDFTVSAWVFPRVVGPGDKMVLGTTGPAGVGAFHFGLRGTNIHFGFYNNDITGNVGVPVNAWTHLAWTFNSHGGQMAAYVNGRLAASAVGRANTIRDGDVLIGFAEAVAGSYFQGFIDELAIFCQALTPSQILALAGPSGGIAPNGQLPEPQLAPNLTLLNCTWNMRDIYSNAVLPTDLPSAEYIAASGLGTAVNTVRQAVNFYDPDINPPFPGFFSSDLPFASDDLTPQGVINGDDNYFVVAGRTTLHIVSEDDYTVGFQTDDGARLRIKGAVFKSSVRLDTGNPANPAHAGDTLRNPANTGASQTLGTLHLRPGAYEVEFLMWELGGGAHAEVFAARGTKTAVDGDFRLLSPGMFLPVATVSVVRSSPTNVTVSWAPSGTCARLQSAPTVTGPWTDVPGATNGGRYLITAGARFYRLGDVETTRFASRVLGFSSQYSSPDWSAAQAVGAPNVYPSYGDHTAAWASAGPDNQREFIDLGYDDPVSIRGVSVYETYAPGAVDRIQARNVDTRQWVVVWTGTAAPAPAVARIFTVTFPPTAFRVDAIRVELNSPAVPDWNEIDAVSIHPSMP